MQHEFWHNRWQKNEIGFHLPEANPLLVKHFSTLHLKQGSRVFLPLCGKTLDIAWLLAQGYQVAGAELSALAIDDLFNSLNLTPTIIQSDNLTHYSAANIDVFVGDIFNITAPILGHVDAVYDRAALVALPPSMRKMYSSHMMTITQCAPQLLVCFEYDQTQMDGPPFCVNADEVRMHYQQQYAITLLESAALVGGLKGKFDALEQVWWLKPSH